MTSKQLQQLSLATLALLGLALGAFLVLRTGVEEPATVPTAAVQTAVAQRGSLSAVVLGYGTVASASAHTRIIVMPHEGMIASVDVHDGSAVRAGQSIVTIALAPAAAAQFAQARSALDFARGDLARVERLFGAKLATNDQVAAAHRALADAQALFDQQTEIGSGVAQDALRAPFDGVITALAAIPGDRPQVGAPLATLSSRSQLVVQLGLDRADAANLAPGAVARLNVPGNDTEIAGTLSAVGAAVDPITHLVKSVVQIPAAAAAQLTLGMTLVAHVELPAREGIVVPRSALLEDADGPYLFTVVDGKAHRQSVQIAAETNESVLIAQALEAGATVITAGNAALEDGVAVKP